MNEDWKEENGPDEQDSQQNMEEKIHQQIDHIEQTEREVQDMEIQTENRYSYIPPEPEKPEKKGGFWKKALGIVAAAVVFGLVAGGTFIGVNAVYEGLRGDGQISPETGTKEDVQKEQENGSGTGSSVIPTQSTGKIQLLDVSDVVSQAMPSVVAITTELEYSSTNLWGHSTTQKAKGSGSGVIIGQNDSELLIVTNAHVVSTASNTYYEISSTGLKVTFADGSELDANLKGMDSDADLAVIAVSLDAISGETKGKISIAEIGNSDELRVGNGVIAIGNALGFGQSVTVGYISALNRDVTIDGVTRSLLQTDAAINPGNSGGALLNTKGELIGINAAKYSEESVEGIGYAIPITKAMDVINNLKEKNTKVEVAEEERGYLGIKGATVDNASIQLYGMPAGVYVGEILEKAPAARSELRPKDIITKLDGETVSSMADLQNLLRYYKAGETVPITVKRLENGQYEEKIFDVTLADAGTLD